MSFFDRIVKKAQLVTDKSVFFKNKLVDIKPQIAQLVNTLFRGVGVNNALLADSLIDRISQIVIDPSQKIDLSQANISEQEKGALSRIMGHLYNYASQLNQNISQEYDQWIESQNQVEQEKIPQNAVNINTDYADKFWNDIAIDPSTGQFNESGILGSKLSKLYNLNSVKGREKFSDIVATVKQVIEEELSSNPAARTQKSQNGILYMFLRVHPDVFVQLLNSGYFGDISTVDPNSGRDVSKGISNSADREAALKILPPEAKQKFYEYINSIWGEVVRDDAIINQILKIAHKKLAGGFGIAGETELSEERSVMTGEEEAKSYIGQRQDEKIVENLKIFEKIEPYFEAELSDQIYDMQSTVEKLRPVVDSMFESYLSLDVNDRVSGFKDMIKDLRSRGERIPFGLSSMQGLTSATQIDLVLKLMGDYYLPDMQSKFLSVEGRAKIKKEADRLIHAVQKNPEGLSSGVVRSEIQITAPESGKGYRKQKLLVNFEMDLDKWRDSMEEGSPEGIDDGLNIYITSLTKSLDQNIAKDFGKIRQNIIKYYQDNAAVPSPKEVGLDNSIISGSMGVTPEEFIEDAISDYFAYDKRFKSVSPDDPKNIRYIVMGYVLDKIVANRQVFDQDLSKPVYRGYIEGFFTEAIEIAKERFGNIHSTMMKTLSSDVKILSTLSIDRSAYGNHRAFFDYVVDNTEFFKKNVANLSYYKMLFSLSHNALSTSVGNFMSEPNALALVSASRGEDASIDKDSINQFLLLFNVDFFSYAMPVYGKGASANALYYNLTGKKKTNFELYWNLMGVEMKDLMSAPTMKPEDSCENVDATVLLKTMLTSIPSEFKGVIPASVGANKEVSKKVFNQLMSTKAYSCLRGLVPFYSKKKADVESLFKKYASLCEYLYSYMCQSEYNAKVIKVSSPFDMRINILNNVDFLRIFG